MTTGPDITEAERKSIVDSCRMVARRRGIPHVKAFYSDIRSGRNWIARLYNVDRPGPVEIEWEPAAPLSETVREIEVKPLNAKPTEKK